MQNNSKIKKQSFLKIVSWFASVTFTFAYMLVNGSSILFALLVTGVKTVIFENIIRFPKPICYYREFDDFFDCPGPGLMDLFVTEDHIDQMYLIKCKLFAFLYRKKTTNTISKGDRS